jgi:glycosyltransferase involved in cell wall biosynthesis
MKIAYIVTMFPCWSETFVLNELVEHRKAEVDLSIYSLKTFGEKMIHDEAFAFIPLTTYPPKLYEPRLWLQHVKLFLSTPRVYLTTLSRLVSLKARDQMLKLKAIAVFFLSPKFIKAARSDSIEHLHAHFATYPGIMAWIIKKFTGIPFSVTAHAHDIYANQDLLPIICEAADRIVTISSFNKQFITEKTGSKYEKKIEVIYCGINLEQYQFMSERPETKRPDRTLDILSIGRLSGIKGFPYLIDALRLLKEDGIEFRCRIVGDGPLRDSLIKQLAESGLNGNVDFLGPKKADEIPGLLREADLFVLACSRDKKEGHDGIPVVFMEAMACGTPVIGTSLSGIPELIRHGKTGLCAESEDALSLAGQIRYALHHPDEREEMRIAARKLVEREFDILKTSENLRLLFEQSIKERMRQI